MANEWKRGTFTYDAVGLSHVPQNIMNGFNSFLTQCGWALASWSGTTTDQYFTRTDYLTSDVWKFNGDGPDQKCGIRITISSLTIRLRVFLENTAGSAAQVDSGSSHEIVITIDNTAPNNYLIIGGEHGLYFESGRDGINNNLGQGFIGTHLPIAEFYGSKDNQRKWSTQGFCCDLFGNLKFASNRTTAFITNDGSSRAFTSQFAPFIARGTSSLYSNTQGNNPQGRLSHKKNIFGMQMTSASSGFTDNYCTFGSAYLSALNNSRYVISQMLFAPTTQTSDSVGAAASVSGAATTGTASTGTGSICDPTACWRQVTRFAQVQYDLTAWANITDAVTSVAYRVCGVADGGRTAKIAVEWPSSGNVLTISL